MKVILRFFRSVRLAVVLILVITALSILATLVPQGREKAFYQENYSPRVSRLITLTGFTGFFHSFLFLAPVLLFSVNLAVCTVARMAVQIRTGAPQRHGPDLVHLGLLLLLAGGLLSFALRRERLLIMAEGDAARISPAYTITLLSFEFQKYDSGMPKAWISTVRVSKNGKVEVPSFAITVNRPLRLSGIRLYQASYSAEGTLRLRDVRGTTYEMKTGQGFKSGELAWYFSSVEKKKDGQWSAVFKEIRGSGSWGWKSGPKGSEGSSL